LDTRLGCRILGGWGPSTLPDIIATVQGRLKHFEQILGNLAMSTRIAVSLPTLPFPPIFHNPGWQSSADELRISCSLAETAVSITRHSNVLVVSAHKLEEQSPAGLRFDLKSQLLTDLPYTIAHADAVGHALARLLQPPTPKKGLITDLDDTVWKGLVGEIGPDSITWDLSAHSQLHGLYQQLLRALSEQGVMIGAASKNDAGNVEKAFAREDILIPADRIFPFEVHWNAKSESITRILNIWNVSADSVVFVDDSPLELAQVKAAHPEIECVSFPKHDYAEAFRFFRRLRDMFGKSVISTEDEIRVESIRRSDAFRQVDHQHSGSPDIFLASVDAVITLDFHLSVSDGRALELVNKTNQFNLNGVRYTETDWRNALTCSDAFLLTATYQDKFGPLGRIAVMQGRRQNGVLHVSTWVMSCRAFARRVEHQCMRALFERFPVDEIRFDFACTPRNTAIQEFFTELTGYQPAAPFAISRGLFEERCPALYHKLRQTDGSNKVSISDVLSNSLS
jgi:FkbH-like protein